MCAPGLAEVTAWSCAQAFQGAETCRRRSSTRQPRSQVRGIISQGGGQWSPGGLQLPHPGRSRRQQHQL